MDRAAPKPPSLPALKTVSDANLCFAEEAEFSDFVLSNSDLSAQEGRFVQMNSGIFTKVRLNSCLLEKLRISDVRFETCDLSNSIWKEGKANRLEIVDSKLTGFQLTKADLSNLLMDNCMGKLVQFHSSKFKNTTFKNCQLKGADFRYCDLSNVRFINCDLQEAEFYYANLCGTDFRGSQLQGFKAQQQDLKGAIIDSQQAIELSKQLASFLGFEVNDV